MDALNRAKSLLRCKKMKKNSVLIMFMLCLGMSIPSIIHADTSNDFCEFVAPTNLLSSGVLVTSVSVNGNINCELQDPSVYYAGTENPQSYYVLVADGQEVSARSTYNTNSIQNGSFDIFNGFGNGDLPIVDNNALTSGNTYNVYLRHVLVDNQSNVVAIRDTYYGQFTYTSSQNQSFTCTGTALPIDTETAQITFSCNYPATLSYYSSDNMCSVSGLTATCSYNMSTNSWMFYIGRSGGVSGVGDYLVQSVPWSQPVVLPEAQDRKSVV